MDYLLILSYIYISRTDSFQLRKRQFIVVTLCLTLCNLTPSLTAKLRLWHHAQLCYTKYVYLLPVVVPLFWAPDIAATPVVIKFSLQKMDWIPQALKALCKRERGGEILYCVVSKKKQLKSVCWLVLERFWAIFNQFVDHLNQLNTSLTDWEIFSDLTERRRSEKYLMSVATIGRHAVI